MTHFGTKNSNCFSRFKGKTLLPIHESTITELSKKKKKTIKKQWKLPSYLIDNEK